MTEVAEFETVPLGSNGSRVAVERWSDGSLSEELRWRDDEMMVSEGDLTDKTRDHLASLEFRRKPHLLGIGAPADVLD